MYTLHTHTHTHTHVPLQKGREESSLYINPASGVTPEAGFVTRKECVNCQMSTSQNSGIYMPFQSGFETPVQNPQRHFTVVTTMHDPAQEHPFLSVGQMGGESFIVAARFGYVN